MTQTQADHAVAIACLNVRYSPNLGDGLLAECLESALRDHGAAAKTRSIDLAGRTRYGQTMAGRGAVMTVLETLPGPLRQAAIRLPLFVQSRRKWGPHYRAGLSNMDAVAIGGGNLISDLDLNFPTKLALGMHHARSLDLPAAIYACGMSRHWTQEGLRRMQVGFSQGNLRAVFLRDQASKMLWDQMMADRTGHKATVVRDPGLMASQVWPLAEPPVSGRIGIGIMSHIALRYHADTGLEADALHKWYLDLIGELTRLGRPVLVFTNGAPEDVVLLDRLRPALPAGVEIDNPATPAELARLIGGCAGIVAYRMHAVIAAYSYGRPALALAWDAKLASFMDSVGRSEWLRDPASMPAAEAAHLMIDGIERGMDSDARRQVLTEARADVGKLLASLSG